MTNELGREMTNEGTQSGAIAEVWWRQPNQSELSRGWEVKKQTLLFRHILKQSPSLFRCTPEQRLYCNYLFTCLLVSTKAQAFS